MPNFDFTALDSIRDEASQRAVELPAQETIFIDSLNVLSEQQADVRTSTMVAKTQADQKASTYLAESQANQKKMLAAGSNPFHDIVAFFTDEQSTDELLAEQQKIQFNVDTLNTQYNSVAKHNEFKAQSLQAQIDKIKTIEAVRSGNTQNFLACFPQSKVRH